MQEEEECEKSDATDGEVDPKAPAAISVQQKTFLEQPTYQRQVTREVNAPPMRGPATEAMPYMLTIMPENPAR